MSHGGRVLAAGASLAVAVVSLAACSLIPLHRSAAAQVSTEDGGSGQCMVGHWRQVGGWQRIEGTNLLFEIRLLSGGYDEVINADGTSSLAYNTPAVWKNTDFNTKITVTYSGRETMTYTAKDGRMNVTGDTTRLVSVLNVNGKDNPQDKGVQDAKRTWTFRCGPTEMTLADKNVWVLLKRQ